jgi:hypothetical protein
MRSLTYLFGIIGAFIIVIGRVGLVSSLVVAGLEMAAR